MLWRICARTRYHLRKWQLTLPSSAHGCLCKNLLPPTKMATHLTKLISWICLCKNLIPPTKMATHLTKLSSWVLVQELVTTYKNGNSPYQAQLMGACARTCYHLQKWQLTLPSSAHGCLTKCGFGFCQEFDNGRSYCYYDNFH